MPRRPKSEIVKVQQQLAPPTKLELSAEKIDAALAEEEVLNKFVAAYKRLLDADHPAIVRDYADRVLGPVKRSLDVSGEVQHSDLPMAEVPSEALMQLIARLASKK